MSACHTSRCASLRPARQAPTLSRCFTITAQAAQVPATGRPAASHRPPAAAAADQAADGASAASRRAALAAVVAGIAAVGAQPAVADENAPRQGEVRRSSALAVAVRSPERPSLHLANQAAGTCCSWEPQGLCTKQPLSSPSLLSQPCCRCGTAMPSGGDCWRQRRMLCCARPKRSGASPAHWST